MPKRNVTFTDNGGADQVGFGFLDDDTHQIKLFYLDQTLLTNQTLADDAAARAEIAAQATAQGWDAPIISATTEVTATLKKVASLVATVIFDGVISAATNIHGTSATTGDETDLPWDATVTNDTDEIDSFTNGDTEIPFLNAGEIYFRSNVHTQGGANNRNTYALKWVLLNSADVVKQSWLDTSMYIRDDNNAYDSGNMSNKDSVVVEAGDKLVFRSVILDVQTTTATVTADTTLSRLVIEKREYVK